jgi:hypothetical protein
VTPTTPVSLGDVRWYTYFRMNSPAGAAQPYLYDLVFPSTGTVPAQFAAQVPASSLATLDTTYAAGATVPINTFRASYQSWEAFPIRFASAATAPLRRTEYVSALPGVGWVGTAVSKPDEYNGVATSPLTEYRAEQQTTDHYLMAPAVPGVDRSTLRPQPCSICRQGDQLLLNMQPLTDAGGHSLRMVASATATVSSAARMYADDTLLAEGPDPVGVVTIPSDATRMRLELDTAASAAWATTATKVTTAWSWRTATPSGSLPAGRTCADATLPCAFQPLLFADYNAGPDVSNAIAAGTATPLTVNVRRQAYDTTAGAGQVTLQVSGDDGATWTAVRATAAGGGKFTATVTPAAGSGFLSLRLHAADSLGGTLDQTVIRALRVTG